MGPKVKHLLFWRLSAPFRYGDYVGPCSIEWSKVVGLSGRILALDWGSKRIGLAMCDELGVSVRGLPTLERTRKADDLAKLTAIAEEYEVHSLLMGRPLHLDGSKSKSAVQAEHFGRSLAKRSGLPLKLWDERLSSVEAEEHLRGTQRSRPRGAIDRAAAETILRRYLKHRESSGEDGPEV